MLFLLFHFQISSTDVFYKIMQRIVVKSIERYAKDPAWLKQEIVFFFFFLQLYIYICIDCFN